MASSSHCTVAKDDVVHSFVHGAKKPSPETVERVDFVKSFLSDFYNSVSQQRDSSSSSSCTCSGRASKCNSTERPCSKCNNNSADDKPGSGSPMLSSATEHPSVFYALNGADDAEKSSIFRDLSSKLTEKINGKYKQLRQSMSPSAARDTENSISDTLIQFLQSSSDAKDTGEVSQQLKLFVDNINEYLQQLGTTNLTAEELKLLLATAPLPCINQQNANTESECADSPRTLARNRSNSLKESIPEQASENKETGRPRSKSNKEIHKMIDESKAEKLRSSSGADIRAHNLRSSANDIPSSPELNTSAPRSALNRTKLPHSSSEKNISLRSSFNSPLVRPAEAPTSKLALASYTPADRTDSESTEAEDDTASVRPRAVTIDGSVGELSEAEENEEDVASRPRAETISEGVIDRLSLASSTCTDTSEPLVVDGDSKAPLRKKISPKRRLKRFISKKMDSFSNLLELKESHKERPLASSTEEKIDETAEQTGAVQQIKEEGEVAYSEPIPIPVPAVANNRRSFSKMKSFNFGSLSRSSDNSFKVSSLGSSPSGTPGSGYSTPRSGDEGGDPSHYESQLVTLKLKVISLERSLNEETTKRVDLEEMVFCLKNELERAQKQNENLVDANTQMGIELRLLRQEHSTAASERQQHIDALAAEVKKRHAVEAELRMIVQSCKEKNVEKMSLLERATSRSTPTRKSAANMKQEAILAQQREEVLLAVTQSMRTQMDDEEAGVEKLKMDWYEERHKYQERIDLLLFQMDQLSMKLNSSSQLSRSTDFDSKIEEVSKSYLERNSSRRSSLNKSVEISRDSTELASSLEGARSPPLASTKLSTSSGSVPPPLSRSSDKIEKSEKNEKNLAQRMKLFFLSSFWWPNFESLRSDNQPVRTPVLLLQIAWWVAELREYAAENSLSSMLSPHDNQFCNCDDCVLNIRTSNPLKRS